MPKIVIGIIISFVVAAFIFLIIVGIPTISDNKSSNVKNVPASAAGIDPAIIEQNTLDNLPPVYKNSLSIAYSAYPDEETKRTEMFMSILFSQKEELDKTRKLSNDEFSAILQKFSVSSDNKSVITPYLLPYVDLSHN